MTLDKKHILPGLLIVSGILDQVGDFIPQFVTQLGLPDYVSTGFRIVVGITVALKLYLTDPKKKKDGNDA